MSKERSLDVEKVNSALKRAAAAATSGDRNARAGRFTAVSATKKHPSTTVVETVKKPAASESEYSEKKK